MVGELAVVWWKVRASVQGESCAASPEVKAMAAKLRLMVMALASRAFENDEESLLLEVSSDTEEACWVKLAQKVVGAHVTDS